MVEIDTRAVLEFDEREGVGFLSFRDQNGHLLDGSAGLDSLARGLSHKGQDVSARYRQLLALAAEHGGRWRAGRGFAVREEALPDLLRAVRTLPEQGSPREEPSVAGLRIDARPVSVVDHVDLEGDSDLVRTTRFATPDGVELPLETVAGANRDKLWIRSGNAFQRRPDLGPSELEEISKAPTLRLTGDDVPFFFAKQLERLKAERSVVLGSRAADARVAAPGKWMTEVSVELSDEGRLRLGIGFLAGDNRLPWSGSGGSRRNQRFVKVGKDNWVWNDQETQKSAEAAINQIPGVEPLDVPGQFIAPAQALPLVQETFAALGSVKLSDAAEDLRRKLLGFDGIADYPVPQGLKAELRPYQKAGYNWLSFLRHYGLGGILADDMGLGKTVQTLASVLSAVENGDDGASIVVCPASVTNVWAQEIDRWCHGLRGIVLTGSIRDRYLRAPPKKTIAIVSYNALARSLPQFQRVVWNYAILDEAHRIKNPGTAQSKACKALLAKHRLAVTGTPIQNRLSELWSIFDFLMQGYLGQAASFQRQFEIPITVQGDQAAAEALRRRIDPFKLRRTKKEVASDLPTLTQQVVGIDLEVEQRRLYDRLLRDEAPELIARLKSDAKSTMIVFEKLLRLRQVAAHPALLDPSHQLRETSGKFEALVELLDDALEEGHKVLIFSQWTKMAELVRHHLRTLEADGVRHLYLDGGVPLTTRRDLIAEFQKADGPQVMVLSLLAGGEGITLTEADVVILYDRWWNPATEDQAIARAHRIGQTEPVTAYILEAKNTIEERLADLLRRKKELASSIVGEDFAEKRVSRELLLELLEEELSAARTVEPAN